MDKHNATLKQLLDTLSENNGSADWNMYKTKRRQVCVKIYFDEPMDESEVKSDLKTDNERSFGPTFKLVSEPQTKRNFLRAKSYETKDKKRKLSKSPEIFRNASVSESDPGNAMNSVFNRCLSTESLTHTPTAMEVSDLGSASLIQSSPEISLVCPLSQNVMFGGSSDTKGDQPADKDRTVTLSVSDKIDSIHLDVEPSSNQELDINEVSNCNVPTPFDSDSDSNYDENADYIWEEFRKPCTKSGCDYRPENMPGFDEKTQLGWRKNGSHGLYYLCELCGRKFCDDCCWVRRRHLHHMKYVQRHTKKGPRGYVDIDRLLSC